MRQRPSVRRAALALLMALPLTFGLHGAIAAAPGPNVLVAGKVHYNWSGGGRTGPSVIGPFNFVGTFRQGPHVFTGKVRGSAVQVNNDFVFTPINLTEPTAGLVTGTCSAPLGWGPVGRTINGTAGDGEYDTTLSCSLRIRGGPARSTAIAIYSEVTRENLEAEKIVYDGVFTTG